MSERVHVLVATTKDGNTLVDRWVIGVYASADTANEALMRATRKAEAAASEPFPEFEVQGYYVVT